MTAYNSQDTIKKSIESVLEQTNPNFQLLIVDDASTDKTSSIIASFDDTRIRSVRNTNNLYIAEAANVGLSLIDTKYILRIDSDDLCLPDRLYKQLNFMEKNKDVGVCGSYVKFFGSKNDTWRMPLLDTEIKAQMLFNNSFANSSTIIRTEVLKKNNIIYHDIYRYPPMEDYDLWMRLIPFTKFSNIDQVLVHKRVSDSTYSEKYLNKQKKSLTEFFKNHYKEFGIELNGEELNLITQFSLNFEHKEEMVSLEKYHDLLIKIFDFAKQIKYFNEVEIRKICHKKWLLLTEHISPIQIKTLKKFTHLSRNLDLRNPLIWYLKKKIKKNLTDW